jgi:hypothetical protein
MNGISQLILLTFEVVGVSRNFFEGMVETYILRGVEIRRRKSVRIHLILLVIGG